MFSLALLVQTYIISDLLQETTKKDMEGKTHQTVLIGGDKTIVHNNKSCKKETKTVYIIHQILHDHCAFNDLQKKMRKIINYTRNDIRL